MRVTRIPIDDAQWWEFVSSHPAAGPFHLPPWTTVIADCYRFEPFALIVKDDDGEVLAGMPVIEARSPLGRPRWVSLPFSDSCPLLVRPGVSLDDVVGPIAEHVLTSRTRELEVRSELPPAPNRYPIQVGYIHRIELPSDPHDLHVRKNHRNMSNRARRRGVHLIRGTSAEDLAIFYRLHTLTRRRLGVPVQPRRFFDLIAERMLAQGHGFVLTAMLDDEPVSAAVYLSYNGVLVSKYHATGPVRTDDGTSHLIDSEAISLGFSEGYHTIDLGRTDMGAEGLRLYKAGWGTIETPLIYTHVSHDAPGTGFPVQGSLSRRIIEMAPPWVCRVLGEVLYRWTA